MRACVIVCTIIAAVAAVPTNTGRIVGGHVTSIDRYPEMASMLVKWSPTWFMQECGATILNNRSILSAAHCFFNRRTNIPHPPSDWRFRVGSTMSNSGGTVYNVANIIFHPNFYPAILDNDIAILRSQTEIVFSELVQPGRIAGALYDIKDNEVVWAAGWGRTNHVGTMSPQLRHVQVWTINQAICKQRYATRNNVVTDNMLCSGWLDVGGRDQCGGDSGGPLFHNGVVVGVCSWGYQCGLARFPGVNARVTRFSHWIGANA